MNQSKYKNETVSPARFDKQDEDNQMLDETDLSIILEIIHNLTETDVSHIDIKSPLEHQIQHQEMQYSGWRFDRINSMTKCFFKSTEIIGSSYVKMALRRWLS